MRFTRGIVRIVCQGEGAVLLATGAERLHANPPLSPPLPSGVTLTPVIRADTGARERV